MFRIRRFTGWYELFLPLLASWFPWVTAWAGMVVETNEPPPLVLENVSISGIEYMEENEVIEYMNLPIGSRIEPQGIDEALGRLMLHYQDDFFYDTKAGWKLLPTENEDGAVLVLQVTEGPRGKIESILFEGNSELPDKKLRDQLQMTTATPFSVLSGAGTFRRQELSADQKTIEDAYLDLGYLAVSAEPEVEIPSPDTIHLKWTIREGRLYRLQNIHVEGAGSLSVSLLEQIVNLKKGAPASMQQVKAAGERLKNAYENRGFADVKVGMEWGDISPSGEVDVLYTVEEGGLVYIGEQVITGNGTTKDQVIRRELITRPGDLYVGSHQVLNKQRLDNLGFFEPVTVKASETEDGRRDVYYETKDRPTGRAQVGAYYSTTEKLVGTLELSQQNFDLFNFPGFKGAGQKARLLIQAGAERKDVVIDFTEPWFMGRRLSLGLGVFYRDHAFLSDDYDQLSVGGSTTLGIPVSALTRFDITYVLQSILIYNVAEDAPDSIKSSEGRFLKSEIHPAFIRDSRDKYFRSTRGNRTSLGASYSGGMFLGDVHNYGFSARTSSYFPLFKRNTLNLRGYVQTVDAFGESEDVPVFDRMFLGGPHSLRGFEYRQASPKAPDGSAIGGNTAYMANIEHFVRATDWLDVSIYYDFGVVNSESYEFSVEQFFSNWGVGFTFDIPNFPLRFDYAIPLETDEFTDKDYNFSFSGGFSF